MGRYQPSGYLVDPLTGVLANQSGGDRLKPTESGEFANTIHALFWRQFVAAAANIVNAIAGSNVEPAS